MEKKLVVIILLCFQLFMCCKSIVETTSWKNIISVHNLNSLISQPYAAVFFTNNDWPMDASAQRFNDHFANAGEYLGDFGITVGVVDCSMSLDLHECHSKQDSDKVYFYRNGRLLTDLALDTMFNVDAIVANILHLVLLQEVPLLQTKAELEKIMSRAAGKRDVIFGRINAVGIPEDRAFIETAFAYNQKYQFVMATANNNFGIDW